MLYRTLQNSNSMRRQKGIATILIVVLVGVALIATSMGVMHSIRSTQEKHIAVHAVTHAQTGVWTGVEAFRLYLNTLTPAQLTALPSTIALSVGSNAYGNMSATGVSVTGNATSGYKVNASIVNKNTSANASAAVGVVYEMPSSSCTNCVQLSAPLQFRDDLDVGGQITFNMPSGGTPNINVDGDISMLSVGATNFGILKATGNVNLDSNVRATEIQSNGNVSLTGDAQATKVNAMGTVTTGGSGGAGTIWANGAITYNGSYLFTGINSLSTMSLNPASTMTSLHGIAKAKGNVTVNGNAKLTEIQTKGNISIVGNPQINTITAEGNLTCNLAAATWNNFTTMWLNTTVPAGCTTAKTTVGIKTTENAGKTVQEMIAVTPVTIPRTAVDVWTLKNKANYIFEWDSVKGKAKLTVNNINGVPNGAVYWIKDNPHGGSSAGTTTLCTAATTTTCTAATGLTLDLCIGQSDWNQCFSYNTTTSTWKFDGKHAVPGVLWFKGNVEFANGSNFGTVLATGNVTAVSAALVLTGVNYGHAGSSAYNTVCLANLSGITGISNIDSTYTAKFSDQYPTNLCNKTTSVYIPDTIGNIGVAAGGYDPSGAGVFSGGNIDIAANSKIYGIVLAGNYLVTGGQTEIYGAVSAAVQGTRGVKNNNLAGNTTVDLTRGNTSYNPTAVPDMTTGACPDCAGLGYQAPSAKILWSKYL
jgi:hypothetical protein